MNNLTPRRAEFLDTFNRSPRTLNSYRNAMNQFESIVGKNTHLSEEAYKRFLIGITHLSPATQLQYRTAILSYFTFCKVGNLLELKAITKHHAKKVGRRMVKFDMEAIETLIAYCEKLRGSLIDLRDRAYVLTAADTGLRIFEAVTLKRGDVDWQNRTATVIGKGDKEGIIYFSERSINALEEYLSARAKVENNSNQPLASQPLFAAHGIGASKKIKPITEDGIRKAIKGTADGKIKGRMLEAGIERNRIRIHDLRHYFVTVTYIDSNDMVLTRDLARHEDVSTTGRYSHFGGSIKKAHDRIFNKKKRGK
jgi:integrase/recombinase XerC